MLFYTIMSWLSVSCDLRWEASLISGTGDDMYIVNERLSRGGFR